MKITKQQLKQTIKEELNSVLNEQEEASALAWAEAAVTNWLGAGHQRENIIQTTRESQKKAMAQAIRRMKVMNLALENIREEGQSHKALYRQYKLAREEAEKMTRFLGSAAREEAILLVATRTGQQKSERAPQQKTPSKKEPEFKTVPPPKSAGVVQRGQPVRPSGRSAGVAGRPTKPPKE
tara:strand:- start:70 stop:612 length:543 start_codon:yes stop_codon:yes gene_type:complete